MNQEAPPFLVVTAILDGAARAAAVTLSHGEALERASVACGSHPVAGLDIVELPIAPAAFTGLRKHFQLEEGRVALYDLIPLSSKVSDDVRRLAGQFVAAEILWTLEEQGLLNGVPLNLKLDLPVGWSRDPREVHQRLVAAGALDLGSQAVETFKNVKATWDGARD